MEADPSMREVLVYLDEGVSFPSYKHTVHALKEELAFLIRTVDHRFFLTTDWHEKTALVVFPGGRDLPYHTNLQGLANRNIQAYVQKGGSFLGICAGGYYGAAEIEFEKDGELEICASRELGFFSGKAIGPAYGNNLFRYESEAGAREAWIEWEQGFCSVYFNGGCRFEGTEACSNVKVIARYNDLPETPPAVVHCRVGKGVALLSGVHPEYITEELEESPKKAFWRYLLSLCIC